MQIKLEQGIKTEPVDPIKTEPGIKQEPMDTISIKNEPIKPDPDSIKKEPDVKPINTYLVIIFYINENSIDINIWP